jgi:hypothetical protein
MPLTKATQNPVSFIRNIRNFGINGHANSSGGAGGAGVGGFAVNCGTSATAYGKTAYSSAYSQLQQRSGSGIDLTSGVGVYGIGMFSIDTAVAGQAFRMIVGDDNQATPPANSVTNAISTRGFGFEIYNNSGTRTVRLFAHDGTTYSTSSGVASFNFSSINKLHLFWVKNDSAGNVYLHMVETAGTNNGGFPPFPSDPIVKMTGGPTANTGAKRYVTGQALTDGTNNPANVLATIVQIEQINFTQGI